MVKLCAHYESEREVTIFITFGEEKPNAKKNQGAYLYEVRESSKKSCRIVPYLSQEGHKHAYTWPYRWKSRPSSFYSPDDFPRTPEDLDDEEKEWLVKKVRKIWLKKDGCINVNHVNSSED